MSAPALRITRVDPADADARWCVAQYQAELARRFDAGFDPRRSLPADDDALRPPRGAVLVASVGGAPRGHGAVTCLSPGVGTLKRMWVAADARGAGVGHRLLAALEAEALALGVTTLRLETNRALGEAIRLYRRAGYVEVPPFSDEPYAHHWFEKRLP